MQLRQSPANIWDRILDRLEGQINPQSFSTWLRPTRLARDEGERIVVSVPSELFANWLTRNYLEMIRGSATDLERQGVEISFEFDEKAQSFPAPGILDTAAVPTTPGFPSSPLNPKYTFESFVVSSSNELAHAAALRVAEEPVLNYNPLYIYGGVGLGKTHLMHAIGNHLRATRPQMRQRYISTETFMNELISSIRFEKTLDFRDRYRGIDLLLIDDIQFLAGKERTQEEFFHTFNALYEAQKQIVFTSDAPPKDIPTLEERLRSRFEWGLIADIQPPDLETKVAILRKKAEEKKVDLPHEVALFIAERVRSNIRELEGHLNRVSAFASLTGNRVSIELTKEALKDLLTKDNKPITAPDILKVVAAHYGIKVSDLKSKSNARPIAYPRQVAMYICKELTDLSYPEIGKIFNNKHHSTVMYSVEKIDQLIQDDQQVARTIEMLTKQFR